MDLDNKNSQHTESKNEINDPISMVFGDDKFSIFLIKKTEKLVSAVYLITNFVSDSDPLKWKLRNLSSEFLSFIIGYKNISSNLLLSGFIKEAESNIFSLISHLDIAFNGGLISRMNHSIIRSEFVSLLNVINSQKTRDFPGSDISRTFFDTGEDKDSHKISSENTVSVWGVSSANRASLDSTKESVSGNHDTEFKRSNRQNQILGLIKKKKEVTIKDISTIIKNCSEKTIQRELIVFMNAGIVKRTGERRWSKYSLV